MSKNLENIKPNVGYIKYKEEENQKYFIVETNKKNKTLFIDIENLNNFNLIYFDNILNQYYIKNKIVYDTISPSNDIILKNYHYNNLVNYKQLQLLSLQRRFLFKLIHIPKFFNKFIKVRNKYFQNQLTNRHNFFKIKKEFVNDFWFKFKRKIIWELIKKSHKNNDKFKGMVIQNKPLSGLKISIGNLYLFFMPFSHLTLKRYPQGNIYIKICNYFLGHIIEFKFLSIKFDGDKLIVISHKKLFDPQNSFKKKKTFKITK